MFHTRPFTSFPARWRSASSAAVYPLILGTVRAGEIFGEMGMITDRPRSATARAVEDTMVESISEDEFEREVLARPDRLRTDLAAVFDRVRRTDLLLEREWRKQSSANPDSPPEEARQAHAALQNAPSSGSHSSDALKHRVRIKSMDGNPHPIDVEITKVPFRICRAPADENSVLFSNNELSIPDRRPHQVSRNHCEIDHEGRSLVVRDRGSTVGTLANNTRIAGAHALCHRAAS